MVQYDTFPNIISTIVKKSQKVMKKSQKVEKRILFDFFLRNCSLILKSHLQFCQGTRWGSGNERWTSSNERIFIYLANLTTTDFWGNDFLTFYFRTHHPPENHFLTFFLKPRKNASRRFRNAQALSLTPLELRERSP